jgi:hypothetical protein
VQAAQWGWLHSKPEKYTDTRLTMLGGAQGIDEGIDGAYLLEALFAVGPSEYRDGAEGSITWAELQAYAQATGDLQEAWEIKAVMAMSKAYVKAKQEGAANVHCIPPVERDA